MSATGGAPRWDGARNLADLGGLPLVGGGTTAYGRVFRSAAPEWLTTRGWDDLRASGVRTVVDLRNAAERGRGDAHPVLAAGATDGVAVVTAPTEDPDDATFLATCGPWLDHPRSWDDNLRLHPDLVAAAVRAVADADPDGAVLLHCAGGRDRTGVVGSILLLLCGATTAAVVANYESGFRGAALHRGHGLAYDPAVGTWAPAADEEWTADELDAALADRRPVLEQWCARFDAEAWLRDAGLDDEVLRRLRARILPSD